jgi:hypothetical protein
VADLVEIFLALRNVRQFVSGADESAKAMAGVGTAAEESGKKAKIGWKGIIKWAGASAAVYGATKFLKGAVGATTDLAKSTLALQRQTTLDTKTASAWVGVLHERNISTKQFQMGLVKLSRSMQTSAAGSEKERATQAALAKQYKAVALIGGKTAPAQLAKLRQQMERNHATGEKSRAMWRSLSVDMGQIGKGNTQTVMLQVADAFKRIENPAQKAALAQQLFGRSGLALLPLLNSGSKGIREQIGLQERYGNVISGKTVKDTKRLIERQREMNAAYNGVKVQLGQALLPVIVQLSKALVGLVRVIQPLTRNATVLKVAIGLLTAAFIAYKLATVAATIASWGLNAAWLASPITWIVVGLVGLGVVLVVLYKKVRWFRDAVNGTWELIKRGFFWIKDHWKLLAAILVGPFGVAIYGITRNFDKIKAATKAMVDWVIRQIRRLINFARNAPAAIGSAAAGIFSKIPGAGTARKVLHALPRFAGGGTMPYTGAAVVGERGPEVLSLPAGARVTPMPGGAAALAGGSFEIRVPVFLDKRQIAEAVGQFTSDKLARR